MTKDHRIVDGRYRLGSPLGQGGMAEVHFGLDIRLCRPVAVKTLRGSLASSPEALALFHEEARSVATLSHPNIVAVYDSGEEVDPATGMVTPYIVMEFVPGRTLRSQLAGGQKASPRRALRLMRDVAAALAYSHEAGIIHQDIKPSNVMVTPTGEVKVMDFGIARRVADAATSSAPAAAVLGTAKYLSPERARGESADARSDLYSAGCLLYELLVGAPPFVGDSPLEIASHHLHDAPVPPSQLVEGIDAEVDTVVLKALAKDRAERFQSAEELAHALGNVLAGRPALARVTPIGALPARPASGAAARRAAGGHRVQPARAAAASASRRRHTLVAAGLAAVLLPVGGVAGYDLLSPGTGQVQEAAVPPALQTTTGQGRGGAPATVPAPFRKSAPRTPISDGAGSPSPSAGAATTAAAREAARRAMSMPTAAAAAAAAAGASGDRGTVSLPVVDRVPATSAAPTATTVKPTPTSSSTGSGGPARGPQPTASSTPPRQPAAPSPTHRGEAPSRPPTSSHPAPPPPPPAPPRNNGGRDKGSDPGKSHKPERPKGSGHKDGGSGKGGGKQSDRRDDRSHGGRDDGGDRGGRDNRDRGGSDSDDRRGSGDRGSADDHRGGHSSDDRRGSGRRSDGRDRSNGSHDRDRSERSHGRDRSEGSHDRDRSERSHGRDRSERSHGRDRSDGRGDNRGGHGDNGGGHGDNRGGHGDNRGGHGDGHGRGHRG
ncbi:MAG: protein kinase domain-containing protein [Friedmanniella sp.]